MKNYILSCLLLPMAFMQPLFITYYGEQQNLISSKWISPINDTCYDTLCFISESKVMYYRCELDLHLEVDYKLLDGKIEINAYSTSMGVAERKMILVEDDGVLKQLSTQQNSFPRNFVKVPEGRCE